MSIYPVKFQEFWAKNHKGFVKDILSMGYGCATCSKKLNYGFWAYHAAPYGYGWGEFWCSEKCLEAWDGKKQSKFNKRKFK